MELKLIENLPHWFRRRPLVLIRFPPGYEDDFRQSKHGLGRFTWAERNENCTNLRLPTICIIEMQLHNSSACYAGILLRKAVITTIDFRLTSERLRPLTLESLRSIIPRIEKQYHRDAYMQQIGQMETVTILTPALSAEILHGIISMPKDREAIEVVAEDLPGLRPRVTRKWEQFDAIKTAMAAFALGKSEMPQLVETTRIRFNTSPARRGRSYTSESP
jgi:hypothetical protein